MSLDLFLILLPSTPVDTDTLNEISKSFRPAAIYEPNVDLKTHTGFLPIEIYNKKTGIETYAFSFSEIAEDLPPNPEIKPDHSLVIHFNYFADPYEGGVALYTAALYAYTYNAIVFDPMSGKYLDHEELTTAYKEMFPEEEN